MTSLPLRSAFWAMAMPGAIAGLVPWRYFGIGRIPIDWLQPGTWGGVALVAVGALLLLASIVDFARRGRGTLSPVDPPRDLVISGPYRYVRNPMYVGVLMVLIGESLLAHSVALLTYAAAFFIFVNLFIVGYEEPTLRSQFGESYDDYCRRVRRWLPRMSF